VLPKRRLSTVGCKRELEDTFLSRSTEAYEHLLKLLERLVDQKDVRIALAHYLGKGDRYITNLFSAKFKIPVTVLLDIAGFLGFAASWLIDKIAPRLPPLPEDQLLFVAEEGGFPADPFLDDLARRLALLKDLPVESKDGLCCYRPMLEALEEERLRDRLSVRVKAEALAEQLLGELLAAGSGPLSGRRLSELAVTLSLWAAIQRSLGSRNLAAKALTAAFPIVRRSGKAWAFGICLRRAGYLLYDLGRPDLSCGLLDQALWHFLEDGSRLELMKVFVDRGAFLAALPDGSTESNRAYMQALEALPESEWINRASAWQGLAFNFHKAGKLDKALQYITEAKAACLEANYILGCVRWREGAILFDQGQFATAQTSMRDALNLMGRYSSAGDIALVALDYSEALIRADHLAEANQLIVDVTRWLPELRSNPLLHRALSRFLDLARIGELTLAEVENTRQTVEASKSDRQALAIR
jgi:tetratricopeptide (TPR) repeat protein